MRECARAPPSQEAESDAPEYEQDRVEDGVKERVQAVTAVKNNSGA